MIFKHTELTKYQLFYNKLCRDFEDDLNDLVSGLPKDAFISRNCPICEEQTEEIPLFNTPSYIYYLCKRCSLAFAKHTLREDISNNKIYNCDSYNKLMRWHYENLLQKKIQSDINIWDEIKMYIPSRKNLLEIGPSFGELLSLLKNEFDNIYGLELNEFCVEKAKELYGLNLINAPIENLDFDENSFDVVILSQVIEHLPDLNLVKYLIRLLKPSGILYIGCPNFNALSMKLFKLKHSHVAAPVHINMFSTKSIEYFARKNHVEVVKCISDNQLDINSSDFYYWFFRRKEFRHRINSEYIYFFDKLWRKIILKYINKKRLLSRYNLGSYLKVVLRRRISA